MFGVLGAGGLEWNKSPFPAVERALGRPGVGEALCWRAWTSEVLLVLRCKSRLKVGLGEMHAKVLGSWLGVRTEVGGVIVWVALKATAECEYEEDSEPTDEWIGAL